MHGVSGLFCGGSFGRRLGGWVVGLGEWVGGSRTSRIENGVIQNGLIEVGAMPESSLAKLGLKHKQTPHRFLVRQDSQGQKKGGVRGWVGAETSFYTCTNTCTSDLQASHRYLSHAIPFFYP